MPKKFKLKKLEKSEYAWLKNSKKYEQIKRFPFDQEFSDISYCSENENDITKFISVFAQ